MSRGNVHIVDDNAEFRASTAFLVEALDYSVNEHGEARAALPKLLDTGQVQPSCLLLDIRMPGMSGLDLHDALAAQGSDIPIIYMTGHGDVPLAVAAMGKGAFTFLQKPLDGDELASALEQALSPEVQRMRGSRADRETVRRTRELIAALTPRELQVVRGIVSDMNNQDMAGTFHLAIKTVELYRSRALKKLGARNAAHLVRLVMSCDGR